MTTMMMIMLAIKLHPLAHKYQQQMLYTMLIYCANVGDCGAYLDLWNGWNWLQLGLG